MQLAGFRRNALIHISELTNYRVENVADVLDVGEEVKVKIIRAEDGKVSASLKVAPVRCISH